ncbi:guanylate kinase [uncultured Desulfobacterium sp.]|uniref:Guanylate kinase n=1 Tax=uncultured Desulfobacterium sp. TaxID=201089 RepID=A0A445MWC8_9BACT|nr:guanylate kinase [uncultured Desulfobacterium sp.]
MLFVFSAPSGAGKTTIVDRLKKSMSGLGYSISHTSRRPRENERDGVHYHFVDKDAFGAMIEDGAFMEWAEVYGNLYGTSFAAIDAQVSKGLDVILDVDPQGARNIRDRYKDSVLIFILPPNLDVLLERLRGRGTEGEGVLQLRFKKAVDEIANCVWYDYIIINDDLDQAIAQARSIILSERCRTSNQLKRFGKVFGID